MAQSNFSAGIWRGFGGDRNRWAVYSAASGIFYFSDRYGRRAAEALARKMNREIVN